MSWRPLRLAAVLLAGAIIPMAAQAISAQVLMGGAASPQQFGFNAQQASQIGLTITKGLTTPFWVYCMCLVVLAMVCVWMASPAPTAAADELSPSQAGPSEATTAPDMQQARCL